MIWAAYNGHTAIVTALLPRLSLEDITKENNEHRTAAQEAERNGHHELAALIVAREQVLRVGLAAMPPREEKAANKVFVPLTPQQRLEKINFTGEVPDNLTCPIARDGCLMADPITIASGFTFERGNLKRYLKPGATTFPCPLSRMTIHAGELSNQPTIFVKNAIDKFVTNKEKKAAKENNDIIKDVINKLVQQIENKDSKQEEKTPSVGEQPQASAVVTPEQKLEQQRTWTAEKRLAFFESQKRNRATHGETALPSNRNVASASSLAAGRRGSFKMRVFNILRA